MSGGAIVEFSAGREEMYRVHKKRGGAKKKKTTQGEKEHHSRPLGGVGTSTQGAEGGVV